MDILKACNILLATIAGRFMITPHTYNNYKELRSYLFLPQPLLQTRTTGDDTSLHNNWIATTQHGAGVDSRSFPRNPLQGYQGFRPGRTVSIADACYKYSTCLYIYCPSLLYFPLKISFKQSGSFLYHLALVSLASSLGWLFRWCVHSDLLCSTQVIA